MVVMVSSMLGSSNLKFNRLWPFYLFNLVCITCVVLNITVIFARWRSIAVASAVMVVFELLSIIHCAFICSKALAGLSNYLTILNSKSSSLIRETLTNTLILMTLRLLLFSAQLFIICFRLPHKKKKPQPKPPLSNRKPRIDRSL
jgi:ABC-type transport system involved in multi-copper enzyme maturation permease subunit